MAAIDFDITKTKVMDAPRDSDVGRAILSMLGEGPWDDALAPTVNVVIVNTAGSLILNADVGSISGGAPDYQTRMFRKGDGGSGDPAAVLADALYDAAMETDSGLLTVRLLPADDADGTPLTVSQPTFKAFTADDTAASTPVPNPRASDGSDSPSEVPTGETGSTSADTGIQLPHVAAETDDTVRMCPAYAPAIGTDATGNPIGGEGATTTTAAVSPEPEAVGDNVMGKQAGTDSSDATETYRNVIAVSHVLLDGDDEDGADSAVALLYSGISVLEANYAMGALTDTQHASAKEALERELSALGYSVPDDAGGTNVSGDSPASRVAAVGPDIRSATDPGDVMASVPAGASAQAQEDIDAIDTLLSLD